MAAVCVLLAALGHALMSGAAVPWWVTAAAVPVTGAPARCLAGRERGPLTVVAATVAAQTALHVAFTGLVGVRHARAAQADDSGRGAFRTDP